MNPVNFSVGGASPACVRDPGIGSRVSSSGAGALKAKQTHRVPLFAEDKQWNDSLARELDPFASEPTLPLRSVNWARALQPLWGHSNGQLAGTGDRGGCQGMCTGVCEYTNALVICFDSLACALSHFARQTRLVFVRAQLLWVSSLKQSAVWHTVTDI